MEVHLHLMLFLLNLHLCLINLIERLLIQVNTPGSIQLLNNDSFLHEMMNLLAKVLKALVR